MQKPGVSGRVLGAHQSGQVLMTVLVALAISTGVYFTWKKIYPQLKEEQKKSGDLLNYSASLKGAVEYMKYAIGKRWTLSTYGVMEEVIYQNLDEWAVNPRNLERLLLHTSSVERAGGLNEQLGRPPSDRAIYLGADSPFTLEVDSSDITQNHPLQVILDPIRDESNLRGLLFKVSRVSNVHYPHGGRGGIFLKIRAAFTKKSIGGTLFKKSGQLFAESTVGYFPRELNTFALIVADDLHLDSDSGDTSKSSGDVNVPILSARPQGSGLRFYSKVFVNNDIIVPDQDGSKYNATTFADAVIIGNGDVRTPKGKFAPTSAGGTGGNLWLNAKNFGGFRKGVKIDGGWDRGLYYLFNVAFPQAGWAAAQTDQTKMLSCIKHSKVLSELAVTKDSKFGVKENVSRLSNGLGGANYNYRLILTLGNFFAKQAKNDNQAKLVSYLKCVNPGDCLSGLYGFAGVPSFAVNPAGDPPVMVLKVKFKNNSGNESEALTAHMGVDSSVSFELKNTDLTMSDIDSNIVAIGNAIPQKQGLQGQYQAIVNYLLPIYEDFLAKRKSFHDALIAAGLQPHNNIDKHPCKVKDGDLDDDPSLTGDAKQKQAECVAARDTLASEIASRPWPVGTSASEKNLSGAEKLVADLQEEIDTLTTQKNGLQTLKANFNKRFSMKIALEPVFEGTSQQPDRIDLKVETNNDDMLVINNLKPVLHMTAYEVGYDGEGTTLRDEENVMKYNDMNLEFQPLSNALQGPAGLDTTVFKTFRTGKSAEAVAVSDVPTGDRTALYEDCEKGVVIPNVDYDFAPSAAMSWNYRNWNNEVTPTDIIFNASNSTMTTILGWNKVSTNWEWPVYSKVPNCIIKSGAELVTGFYVCDKLTIKQRPGPNAKPLTIIGTFIVGSMNIDPTAVKAGISWGSIYHPLAIAVLRNTNRLGKGQPCGDLYDPTKLFNMPIWHMAPSLTDLAKLYACMPTALRGSYPTPFTWTTVDPVCGLVQDSTSTACTYRDKRYDVLTMSYIDSVVAE